MVNPQQKLHAKFVVQQCLESEQAKNNFVALTQNKRDPFQKGFLLFVRI